MKILRRQGTQQKGALYSIGRITDYKVLINPCKHTIQPATSSQATSQITANRH